MEHFSRFLFWVKYFSQDENLKIILFMINHSFTTILMIVKLTKTQNSPVFVPTKTRWKCP